MTGVKRLDEVRNTTVLTSVSRNELIHTVHDRQLRFLGALVTCSETHTLHMPVPMHYISQLTAQQDAAVLD